MNRHTPSLWRALRQRWMHFHKRRIVDGSAAASATMAIMASSVKSMIEAPILLQLAKLRLWANLEKPGGFTNVEVVLQLVLVD